jgi:hypothetical protein
MKIKNYVVLQSDFLKALLMEGFMTYISFGVTLLSFWEVQSLLCDVSMREIFVH